MLRILTRLLRAFLKRQTLISIRDFIYSIIKILSSFIPHSFMASQSSESKPLLKPPNFDPKKPSIPTSYPIKTLEELESRSYFDSFHYPFNKASIFLNGGLNYLPQRPRLLVCHDMAGGYLDGDKWVQGGDNSEAYDIWHWYLMDVFVYFSHNLVTLPPPCWVNAAHKHGVKVLGTFLTEWDEGRIISDKLLSTTEYARMCAERLTELATALGFDGWLINMEVKLNPTQIANMKEFVNHLTELMHFSKPGSLVIWYDSVTVNGDLDWQDQLNDKNKAFFDLCDGIFVNYTWKVDYPKLSANTAGDRKFDVYMGIDVFGRNTYGGGQWSTNTALDVIRKDDVSAAIFAPGWVYETKQPPDFQTAQNRWWNLIEKSWGVMQNYPRTTPFYSDFDQGRGRHFSIEGRQLSDADWCNLSCQSFQPFLEFSEDSGSDDIQVLVNLEEESYGGGGNVTFKGILGSDTYRTKRLFKPKLLLGKSALGFTYSVKSDGGSLVGISLEFLSVEETSDGWVLQENGISMPGYTLTEIGVVCYKLKREINEDHNSEYHAVLGHLLIQTPGQSVQFSPSSSWVVEGQDITWNAGPDKSKSISLSISWRSKNGNDDSSIQKYNIYVQKIPKRDANMELKLQSVQELLGIALVEAFYVSDLLVPSGISAFQFIIQVCGVDGTCQPLNDSPSFQLDLEAPNTL